jgi:hypothetical protein
MPLTMRSNFSASNGVPVAALYSAMENVSSNGTICNLPYMIGDLGCECYIRMYDGTASQGLFQNSGMLTTRKDTTISLGSFTNSTSAALRYRATLVPYKLCRIPSSGFSDTRQTQSSITQTCLERLSNLARTTGPNILNDLGTPWLVPTFINE